MPERRAIYHLDGHEVPAEVAMGRTGEAAPVDQPEWEDAAYPNVPPEARDWLRLNRDLVRVALESPLGRTRRPAPREERKAA